jgi:hypothetical protein
MRCISGRLQASKSYTLPTVNCTHQLWTGTRCYSEAAGFVSIQCRGPQGVHILLVFQRYGYVTEVLGALCHLLMLHRESPCGLSPTSVDYTVYESGVSTDKEGKLIGSCK